jgi:hypothetical protein
LISQQSLLANANWLYKKAKDAEVFTETIPTNIPVNDFRFWWISSMLSVESRTKEVNQISPA